MTQGNDTEMVYVGIKDGTIRAIVWDDTRYAEDTAKLVAEWIRMGRTVERMGHNVAIERMKQELSMRAAAR